MMMEREIRASYDQESIVIFQAYSDRIADAALTHQTFVPPFSFHRMTWIKPSFLWLMHRSNWGTKNNQTRTLAIRITQTGWLKALSKGVLTHPEPEVYANPADWENEFKRAHVHIQWDTERSIRGVALGAFSIQVGISRHLIQEFVDDWIVSIEDLTAKVTKMRDLVRKGRSGQAKRHLPRERRYAIEPTLAARLHLSGSKQKRK